MPRQSSGSAEFTVDTRDFRELFARSSKVEPKTPEAHRQQRVYKVLPGADSPSRTPHSSPSQTPQSAFDFEDLDGKEKNQKTKRTRKLRELGPLGRKSVGKLDLEAKEVDENGFVKVPAGITSDSGAADTVAPEELFTDYPLEESPGSKANVWYVGAGGQRIRNKGQRTILMLTREKRLRWLTVQVAKVKKTLGSVSKNISCGQRVVYDDPESFIEDKRTGEKVALNQERGVFKFDAWVVPFAMVQRGWIAFKDEHGKLKKVKVDRDASFGRQG